MWHETSITKMLNIKLPLIQAGMAGGPTTPELVAAVSNYGGLGTLGAGYMKPEEIREAIHKIRAMTNKPFAVNLFIPESFAIDDDKVRQMSQRLQPFYNELGVQCPELPEEWEPHFVKQIQVIIEESVPVFSFTFGVLGEKWMERLSAKGIKTIGTATTVKEAIYLEQLNVDAIVAQGSEAGGHRGTFTGAFDDAMIGTMALVPQIVDAVQIPVIAAGGIMDGRGVVASLTLGASAVQMGTLFLSTRESGAHSLYKKALMEATEEETIVTTKFSGKAARGLKNDFICQLSDVPVDIIPSYPVQNTLTQPLRKEAAKQGKSEWMSMWAGQGLRLTQDGRVEQVMNQLMEQINSILLNLNEQNG